MSDLDSLLKQIPIDQIATKLGVDHDVAEDAVAKVLPTIVAGLSANSKDKAGAASLEKALAKHEGVPHGRSTRSTPPTARRSCVTSSGRTKTRSSRR